MYDLPKRVLVHEERRSGDGLQADPGPVDNICTEKQVFLCHKTGVGLDAQNDVRPLAEKIVDGQLPGELIQVGSLNAFRNAVDA